MQRVKNKPQTVLLHDSLNLADQHRQVSLRLGHRQSTSRQSDTGRGGQSKRTKVQVVQLVLRQQRLDLRQVLGRDVGQNEMLVRRQPEESLVDFGNLSKTSLELKVGLVLNSTVLHHPN